ncbi:MAG: DUF6607 family protein [Cyclobacteriaceae bacterium]
MKKLFLLITTLAFALPLCAQKSKKQDIEAIKSMCGCYEVDFNFAETFAVDKDYKFSDNYHSAATEYVFAVEETDDKIVLQHLLVINDSVVIKHWRQDWIYENSDLFTYQQDNTWKYQSLKAKAVEGQWTQKVYQVDDSPRYEASATWVHVDGKHYWEAEADAPLPRREITKRKDYNVMKRINRQEITEYGWLHEQDNDKIIRGEDGDQLLAREKGYNTYTNIDESHCKPAIDWWKKHEAFWHDVRAVWDEVFEQKQEVKLAKKVDDQLLFMKLFKLQDKMLFFKTHDSVTVKNEIKKVINQYLQSDFELVRK